MCSVASLELAVVCLVFAINIHDHFLRWIHVALIFLIIVLFSVLVRYVSCGLFLIFFLCLLSCRLQKTLTVSFASDLCLVHLCSSLKTTAWSPWEADQRLRSTGRIFMRDCSMSWHIIMPSTSRTQSVFPHYCLYCNWNSSRFHPWPRFNLLLQKSPCWVEGIHWVSLSFLFFSLCDEDVSEKVNHMLVTCNKNWMNEECFWRLNLR